MHNKNNNNNNAIRTSQVSNSYAAYFFAGEFPQQRSIEGNLLLGFIV
jgi:hypothetical protein